MLKDQIQALASGNESPCVTISLHTHRSHPDNQQDPILLKNLIMEAEGRLLKEYDKRSIAELLKNLGSVEKQIDHNFNLDGLYVFVSATTQTYIRTIWPPVENKLYLDDRFALRDIIKAYNRAEDYYILFLNPGGIQLFEALDEKVQEEVRQEGFPAEPNSRHLTDKLKASDPKAVDNQLKEFLNRIDKNMVSVYKHQALPVIVAATRPNYDLLMEVADMPHIYAGHFSIDYNRSEPHQLVEKAWPIVMELQKARRKAAIDEVFAGVSAGRVYTDLKEIWDAALHGRGELLIVKNDYQQPVGITGKGFEYASDDKVPGITDDIVNDIAWEVLKKNGRVFFTDQVSMNTLGEIALLTRY